MSLTHSRKQLSLRKLSHTLFFIIILFIDAKQASASRSGGACDSVADAQIRAVAEQRRQHDAERKKAADEASHVKYGMTSIADVGECFQKMLF